MRRVYAALICCAVVQLIVPRPAHAWWEYVEQLSGPGPFMGFDFDSRLACFAGAANSNFRTAAVNAIVEAQMASELSRAALTSPDRSPEIRVELAEAAETAWKRARENWEIVAGPLRYAGTAMKEQAKRLERSADKNAMNIQAAADTYEASARALAANVVSDVEDKVRFASVGVIYSSCHFKPGERRRGAIDLGMRFVWKKRDEQFADKHRVSLTTAQPAISWGVIDPSRGPKWAWADVVDYGIGAGFYWISSTEFRTVKGGFLEPLRLDFHAPTRAHWALRMPMFRYSLLVFPGGFEPTAFAAKPEVAHRISRNWVPSYALYADLEPLLNWLDWRKR
jgi:hypothetical protein